ncbi:MAG TPA: cupredoxin domain-containing protein [Chloroflexota bacterium]|nr:cupredoxin domain-containing protein [Chloroflexota bacterium]
MRKPRPFFLPRRLAALLAIALVAFPGALIAGQAANAFTEARATSSAASSMAGMDMSQQPASGKRGPVMMLHHKVIHITINNFMFSPANVAISPGTRIIWTNHDSDPHTVDSTKNVWSSEALDTDGAFARVFKTTGSFAYYCSIHPFMHGTVIVKK